MNKQIFALKKAEEFMRINNLMGFDTYALIKEALKQPLTRDWKETIDERIAKDDEFKKALEQPAQEPVAWMDLHKELGQMKWIGADEGWDKAIEAIRNRLVELSNKKIINNHVAVVSEIYQSRYTIEWNNGSLPQGTKLYTHPAPSQWISVDDKLPKFVTVTSYEKSSDDVLILIDGKHVYIGAYIFDTWSKTDDFCMRDLDGGYEVVEGMKVTHWMPLPEAPKE